MGPGEDDHPTRLLESLPPRPPTPPRDTLNHDLDALPKQLIVNLRTLHTPPGFPSPSASSKDSTTRRKRVGFSAKAQYQDPPIYVDPPSRTQQATPVSRTSSTSRPVKGILKPATAPNRLGPILGEDSEVEKPGRALFAEMLESTLQQLAGADRESKIDAYTMLFRGLKASSNLPDRIALQQKLDVFLQFIQRDLSAKGPTINTDTVLVTSATKLLHTFLRHQGIASSIPSEFGIFLVDHCIKSFHDEKVPKEAVRHLMHTLFLQNFGSNVMTSDRVGRLVDALHDLEGHMSGKSIIQSRIHVYEKLLQQCPQQMAFHSDWIQDLFTDMLSSAAEIRSAAIRLGLSTAFKLNTDQRFIGRALAILNLDLDDKKYVEHIIERLTERLISTPKDVNGCVSVPQIWSVITLFIPKPDSWEHFQSWLKILQSCLNHKHPLVKKEANVAWSRYMYRLFLDGRLGTNLLSHLLNQLKSRKSLRDSVLGSVRIFFYYACRPTMDLKMLDDVWNLGVAPLMQALTAQVEEGNTNITEAGALLTGLINCSTRRIWEQSRIADEAPIKDEELPAIESRWIRANSARVLQIVGPLLAKNFVELSVPGSHSQKLWQAVVGSVAIASTKDVKLHEETAKFVAGAFTWFLAIWRKGPTSVMDGRTCTSSQFLDSARDYILILVEGLGLLPNPFMDRQFVRSKDDKFTLHSSTSSHKSSKHQLSKRTPLEHLFLLASHPPPGVQDDNALLAFFDAAFSPFFVKKGINAQADLARELFRLLPADEDFPYAPWLTCATKILASLEQRQVNTVSDSRDNLGPEFREIVKLLQRGLGSTPNLPWEHWLQIFQRLLFCVQNETGVAGIAIAIVEPLAAVLKDLTSGEHAAVSTKCVLATIELVRASGHPRDKLAIDAARRRLWGASNAGARQLSADPHENLDKLLVCMLEKVYASSWGSDAEEILNALGAFLDIGTNHQVLRALTSLQEGVALWVEDKDHRVTRTDSPGTVKAIESLWQTACRILVKVPAAKLQLNTVEPLFCAAFRSTHREIVTVAATTWNRIYENADDIEYPETLRNVLESLGSSVDIIRPGLEVNDADSNSRPIFTESQDVGNHLPVLSPPRVQTTSVPRSSASHRSASGSTKTAPTRLAQESISSARKTPKGRTPKTKLRHEDSQMQFAAVESSPVPAAQESQLLTDRQKEIRERQRETAAMFPALRSSPTDKTKKAQSTAQQPLAPSASYRASTPENEGGFDDCLASTPTPRRGQSAPLPEQDHEMTDPPSSPPEPRSFSLLAELKSKTRTNPMEEWHFASSPISGSPNITNQDNLVSQAMELDDVDEPLRLDGEGETDDAPQDMQQDALPSDVEVVVNTTQHVEVDNNHLPAVVDADANSISQITPSGRTLRSKRPQFTPQSENEKFVDARSSPIPPTPSRRFATAGSLPPRVLRSTCNSESFNVSASFENGLRNVGTARIEVALRSSPSSALRKREYKAYQDILPESPEHSDASLALQKSQTAETLEISDSIEVGGAEVKKRGRGRSKKPRTCSASQNSQPAVPSTPVEGSFPSQGNFENLSPGNGRWWRKRKRSVSSSVFSSGGSKKARHGDFLAHESVQEEIPDSQPNPDAAAVNEDPAFEMHTAEELHQDRASSVVNGEDSFAEHTICSQELPSAAEDEPAEEDLAEDEPAEEPQPAPAPIPADDAEPVRNPSPEAEAELQCEPEPAPGVEPEAEPLLEVDNVPQEHTNYMDEYMATDDEEAVHSQLAREEQESVSRAASPARAVYQPAAMLQEEMAQLDDQDEVSAPQQVVSAVDEVQPEPVNIFQGLMDNFRRGLGQLRSTELTREQVYEVEDLMFEVRRELLQAEKRGKE